MDPNELVGLETNDGWTIESLVVQGAYQSGGAFSSGYIARKGDRTAFLKALDFSSATRSADPPRAAEDLLRAFNFERDVLALCKGAGMSRVVVAISDGSVAVADAPLGAVWYLLFELADGDLRKYVFDAQEFGLVWRLRALHQIATGLAQLHSRDVFHQDLKPSNILTFSGGTSAKLADLGRAHCRTIGAPHDIFPVPGARSYAPPEQLYSYQLNDQGHAKASADLYHLGSMVFFMFTGTKLTPFLVQNLRAEHRPPSMADNDGGWRGTFVDLLPYLREGFSRCVQTLSMEIRARCPDRALSDQILLLFKSLSDPSPEDRGHPSERKRRFGSTYGLQQYLSAFDYAALRAELLMRRNAAAA